MLTWALILIIGCEKRSDSPVGYGELERDISEPASLRIDSPLMDTTYSTLIPTGSSTSLLVGTFQGYETRALLRFEVSDTQVINHATEAKLRLYRQKSLGTEPMDIDLCAVSDAWDERWATWTEADSAIAWTVAGGAVSDTIASAEIGGVDSITFTIPNSWLSSAIDSSNNGLILISADNNVADFSSRESLTPPVLFVHYFEGNSAKVDTSSPEADAFIIRSDYAVPEGRLMIGDGHVFRSLLNFDLSPVPETATLNCAILSLFVDPSQSSFQEMELAAHRVTGAWDGDQTPFDGAVGSAVEVVTSDTLIQLDIASILQECITGENFGLLLRSTSEVSDISRITLFSSEDDSTKSPNLIIYYTLFPGARGE